MNEDQSEMVFKFNSKTRYTGLRVVACTSVFKEFRAQGAACQTYNDVVVTIDGVEKAFTLNEFRKALGMERRED